MESSKSAEEPETSKECNVASVTAKEPVPSSNYDTESSLVEKLKSCNVDDKESSVVEVSKPSDVDDKESSVMGELKPCNVSAAESLVIEQLKFSNVGDMESSVVEERKSSSVGGMESPVTEERKSSNVGDMESSVAEELKSGSVGHLESSVAEDLKSSNEIDMEYPNREDQEPGHERDMSSSSSEKKKRKGLKAIPYEKGNCCVVLWYIEHFSLVTNYEEELTSPAFIVNIKFGINWFLKLHLKMKDEPSYIGISLLPADTLESNIKLACKINIVQTRQELYAGDDCSTKAIITIKNGLFFPRLLRKDFLACNKFKFLENDTMLIKCELNVETHEEDPKFFDHSIHYGQFRDRRKLISLLIEQLYISRAHADFTWRLADRNTERVHRQFLAARAYNLERLIRGRQISAHGSQRLFSSDLVTSEQAFYLLAYTYSGNPYDVVCVPLGFGELLHACGFDLLKYYTQPNVMACRTRMRRQKMTLSIKIKNFSKPIINKTNYIAKYFCVSCGDKFSSKWCLSMDLKRDQQMHLRLIKISSPSTPFNVEFRTHALNIRHNRYVCLQAQTLTSETLGNGYIFMVQTKHVLGNKALFMPNNHLHIKIFVQITFNVPEESRDQFETRFHSKVALIDEDEPPGFVRLRENVLEMYVRKIYPDLAVITANDSLVAHKLMMIIHSQRFEDFFKTYPALGHLQFEHLYQSTAHKMMLFIYSGILQVDLDDVEDLLKTAEDSKLNYLKIALLGFCRKSLNESTSRKILKIAVNCKEKELEAEIRRTYKIPAESDRAQDPESSPVSSTQSQNLVADVGRSSDQEISVALDSSREDSTSSKAVSLPILDQKQTESLESSAESKKSVVSSQIVEDKDSKAESSMENKNLEAISLSGGECKALEETNRTIKENKDPKATSSAKIKSLYVYPRHCRKNHTLVEAPRTTVESKDPKVISSMRSEDHEASHRSLEESQTSVVSPLVVTQTQDSKVTPRIMNADSEASSSSSEEDQSLVVSPQAVVEIKDPETESMKNRDSNVNPSFNA